MIRINKKGISPVVATVLLITISIILIAIIFIWARSTIGEEKVKFGTDVKIVCSDISLGVVLINDVLDITNNGNTYAIQTVALRSIDGNLYLCDEVNLRPGSVTQITTTACGDGISGIDLEAVIPVIKTDEDDSYNCDKNEISVF